MVRSFFELGSVNLGIRLWCGGSAVVMLFASIRDKILKELEKSDPLPQSALVCSKNQTF